MKTAKILIVSSPPPQPLVYKYDPDTRLGVELPTSAWLTIIVTVGTLLAVIAKTFWNCYREHTIMVEQVEQIDKTTSKAAVEQKLSFDRLDASIHNLDTRLSVSQTSMDNLKTEIKRLESLVQTITSNLQDQKIKDTQLEGKINHIEAELKDIQETLSQYASSEDQVVRQQREIEKHQQSIEDILHRLEQLKVCSYDCD